MKLHLVPADTPPDKPKLKSRTARKPAEMLQCARCGGREVMETVIGATIEGGKMKGGTKQRICVSCMLKGERVVVL